MSRTSSPDAASERTPLIANPTAPDTPKRSSRIPSIIALVALSIAVIVTLAFGFATPALVEEYAKDALVFDAKTLSIKSFTEDGIRVGIKGTVSLDSNKVKSKPVRDLGNAATWIAHKVQTGDATVKVYLPDYNNVLLGSASIPPILLNIRSGHVNYIDLLVDVQPGQGKGIARLARDVLDRKVHGLNVNAVANVPIRSGLISLGTQTVTQSLYLKQGHADIPKVDIQDLEVADSKKGIIAHAQISAMNPYPINFDAPPVAMDILLPDCTGQYIVLGTGKTELIHVLPEQLVFANVTGLAGKLSPALTTVCTDSNKSPLDTFVGAYMEGKQTKLFARGSQDSLNETPRWLVRLLRDMVVPVPVPARKFDNPVKRFSLSDVHLTLPKPNGPDSNPRMSAVVQVVVGIPPGINVNVNINRIRSDADVFYGGEKLGELNLHEWQKANSTRHGEELWVQSVIVDAPLSITDDKVFAKLVQQMLFGKNGITLDMKAKVDIESSTALGQFIVRQIPAEGKFSMKAMGPGFKQKIQSIKVVDTTEDSMTLETRVKATNPTDYSADIPFANVSLWCNGTKLGDAWGSFSVVPGVNNLVAYASYRRSTVAREFLSQYLSGQNVTATVRLHEGSVPGLPSTGLDMNVTVPHVFGRFLSDTTMHIFSSTATFVLHSPLAMSIESLSASAFYNGSDIGNILWDAPFAVIAGNTTTPRLPVDWNNNGGFSLIKEALGGTLKLDARANVSVKIGEYRDTVWYNAKGIGAKVRL